MTERAIQKEKNRIRLKVKIFGEHRLKKQYGKRQIGCD